MKLWRQAIQSIRNKKSGQTGIFFIFVGLCAIAALSSPYFLTVKNLTNILVQMSVVGLISLGVTGVIANGGIDLSSGSVLALASVIAASLAQRPDGAQTLFPAMAQAALPLALPIAAALTVGAACGFANGALTAKTKIPPFIATLGMMTAARGLAQLYSAGRPVSYLTDQFRFIGSGLFLGFLPMPAALFIIAAVFTHILYAHTRFGRYVYAIGSNEQAARVSGIKIDRYRIGIYVYAGFLSALAGLIATARIDSGQPGLGNGYELDAIASAVVGGASLSSGGIGTVWGAVFGALIIGVINNILVLNGISVYWQQIIKGAIIVIAVIIDGLKNKTRAA